MKIEVNDFVIYEKLKIREAINKIDANGFGFILVCNSKKQVLGIVTDGDFRRAVLKGIVLEDSINKILNINFIKLKENYNSKTVINSFLNKNIKVIPVLSKENKLIDLLFRKDYDLENKIFLPEEEQNIDVIIMAGGKGSRMAPFTNVFPKPLIPIGEKSMIETIMDEYQKYGFNNFYISINYKGGLIKSYLNEVNHNYTVSYLEELDFYGTAGALKLYNSVNQNPIFVSNCDILIKENYLNILHHHNENKNDLTLVAAMVNFKIPYGVCKIKKGGELLEITEKPEYDNLVNTGMYVINPSVLKLIPDNEFFHITQLMEKIQMNKGKVGVYPVTEKSWIDVGQWNEYNKVIKEN